MSAGEAVAQEREADRRQDPDRALDHDEVAGPEDHDDEDAELGETAVAGGSAVGGAVSGRARSADPGPDSSTPAGSAGVSFVATTGSMPIRRLPGRARGSPRRPLR